MLRKAPLGVKNSATETTLKGEPHQGHQRHRQFDQELNLPWVHQQRFHHLFSEQWPITMHFDLLGQVHHAGD